MATYRCPECGAPHKEPVDLCRLCGAPMGQKVIRNQTLDQSIAADRFKPKGLGHFAVIGVLVAVALVFGAFAVGAAKADSQTRWVKQHVWFLKDDDPTAGWVDYQNASKAISLKLPNEPSTEQGPKPVTQSGTTTVARSKVGDRYIIDVGNTTDANMPTSNNEQTLQSVAKTIATNYGGQIISHNHSGSPNGYPGLDVTIQGAQLPQGPAYVNVRLWLVDNEVVYVATVSYEQHPNLFGKVLGTVSLGTNQTTTTTASQG